jgi:hypothetical protein
VFLVLQFVYNKHYNSELETKNWGWGRVFLKQKNTLNCLSRNWSSSATNFSFLLLREQLIHLVLFIANFYPLVDCYLLAFPISKNKQYSAFCSGYSQQIFAEFSNQLTILLSILKIELCSMLTFAKRLNTWKTRHMSLYSRWKLNCFTLILARNNCQGITQGKRYKKSYEGIKKILGKIFLVNTFNANFIKISFMGPYK